MKSYFLILVYVWLVSWHGRAQTFSWGAGGQYLYAGQWDRAIQTANFSQPQLGVQPLLQYGMCVNGNFYFNQSKTQPGIRLQYGLTRSINKNAGRRSELQLHQFEIHYLYTPHWFQDKLLRLELSGGIISTCLLKLINGSLYTHSDQFSKALGIGPDMALHFKYILKSSQLGEFIPMLSIGYSPFLWTPSSETIINHTRGLTGNDYTMLTRMTLGLQYKY